MISIVTELNLFVSYEKIKQIENDIDLKILKNIVKNGGIYARHCYHRKINDTIRH